MAMNLKVIPCQHGCGFFVYFVFGPIAQNWRKAGSYMWLCVCQVLYKEVIDYYNYGSLFPQPSSLPCAPPFSGILFPVTFPHPIFLSPFSSSSCTGNFLIFSLLWATTTYLDALSYSILVTSLSSRCRLISHFFSWQIRLSNLFMGIQLNRSYTIHPSQAYVIPNLCFNHYAEW